MNDITHVKDYCDVDYQMYDADFWLMPDGKPVRPRDVSHMESNWVGVKVIRTDVLLPTYLYYCFELLYSQGLWRVLRVNIENVEMITLKSVDHMEEN